MLALRISYTIHEVPGFAEPAVHAGVGIKPDIFFGGESVVSCARLVGDADSGVDEAHGADGVGAEGDAGAHFGESVGGFVEVEGDVAFEEAVGEGEAGDATAADGDFEGFWGLGGCHRWVSCNAKKREMVPGSTY